MDIKKNSYATEEEVDNFFKSPPSLDDIDDSIIERSKEIIDVNFTFIKTAKDHPKLIFLNTINDGKRLEMWKKDYEMISEINVGKYCIDEIILKHKRSMILVLNDISITKSKGDLR